MRNFGAVREFDPGGLEQILRSHVGANRVAQNWAIDYVKSGLESGEFTSWTSIWDCPDCGAVNDRDYQAAKILEEYGWRVLQLLAAEPSVSGDLETGLAQGDEACDSGSESRQTALLTKVNRK